MVERRHRRSADPQQALSFLLESLAERDQSGVVVLSDERGMLLADGGTRGPDADTEAIARAGRHAALGEDDPTYDAPHDLFGARVEIGAATFFLSSLGGRVRRIHEARTHIARILRV
jgi:hypothetical protein